jgi:uncharacterized ParB-like nuclease family protein
MINSDSGMPQPGQLGIFNSARRRAFVQDILAELSGRSDDLLSFDKVREELQLPDPEAQVSVREIPLDKIVGSVGRYRDFNRAFLPRAQVDPRRWLRIVWLQGQGRLPPIDVFKVGEVYFVRDGNHRVSAARVRRHKTIMARVVEIPVRVPLAATTSPEDLILKAGYAEFLHETSLDKTYPDQKIELTRPGGYRDLQKHIEVHQFYMGLRSRHYPSLEEAAANWYRRVYLPVIERIRAANILDRFPGRTEADLYLWIAENRAHLQIWYGNQIEANEAVDDFAQGHPIPAPRRHFRRLLHRVFPRFLSPEPLQASAAIPEGEGQSSGRMAADRQPPNGPD